MWFLWQNRWRWSQRDPIFAYISGSGDGNLGDDALLEAARQLLGGALIVPWGPTWFESVAGVAGLGGQVRFRGAILGGGTLINPMFYEAVRATRDQGLQLWTLGTGVGSSGFEQPPEVDISNWLEALRSFSALGVRGPRSQRRLEAIGINNATVVGDLGLALADESRALPEGRQRIAVNVVLPRSRELSDYPILEVLCRELSDLMTEGWEILPITMSKEDLPGLRRLLDRLPGETPTLRPIASVQDFFDKVRECSLTVAVRLHAAILSTDIGVPPVQIVYRDKCLDFMESMDLADWCVNLEESDGNRMRTVLRQNLERSPDHRRPVLDRALGWRKVLESYAADILCLV